MSRTLLLVWLGASPVTPNQNAALNSWAQARLVGLETVESSGPPSRTDSTAMIGAAAQIESAIDEASTLLGAGDPSRTQQSLQRARAMINAHPPLPQSGWLLAEVNRLARQAPDAAAPSTNGVSTDGVTTDGARNVPLVSADPAAIAAQLRSTDVLYLDGEVFDAARLVEPGRHHMQRVRPGATGWTGWLQVHSNGSLATPMFSAPCSSDDFSSVSVQGTLLSSAGVACPNWVAAIPNESGSGTYVARCRQDSCTVFALWHARDGQGYANPAQPQTEPAPLLGWLGWCLVGVGAGLATGFALWSTDVFDEEPTPAPERRFSGPQRAALRF